MSESPTIIYCHCAYARVIPAEVKNDVLDTLSESGQAFEAVSDLCEMSARKDPRLKELAANSQLRIAACYPRAVKWLFASGEADLSEDAKVINMREDSAENICQALLEAE